MQLECNNRTRVSSSRMSSTHRVRLFPVSCSLCSSAYRNYLFVQSSFPTDYESKRRSSEGDALRPGGVCRWCQVRIMSARNPTNTSNGLESADGSFREINRAPQHAREVLAKFHKIFIKCLEIPSTDSLSWRGRLWSNSLREISASLSHIINFSLHFRKAVA